MSQGLSYTSIGPDIEARVLPCEQVRRHLNRVQRAVGYGRCPTQPVDALPLHILYHSTPEP